MLISFNFEVHQPHRLKKNINNDILISKIKKHSLENNYDYDDVVNLWNRYVDVPLNKEIFNKVAEKCYIPTNRLFLELIDEYDIKLAYSITGVFLEQAMEFNDEVIDLFKDLVKTGNVELIGETYHHSLSSLFSTDEEFKEDILRHRKLIKDLFNYKTKVFRNTELIYHNSIAKTVKNIGGFNGIFTEGADKLLGWRSPNYVYNSMSNLKVLLRNYKLSDDIGFRFSCCNWEEYPLTADKYAKWLANEKGDCINLYVDYETFGEHQWKETGIFEFLKYMPYEIEKYANLKFAKPSEILEKHSSVGEIDVFEYNPISWADVERDISAWYGNKMQRISFEKLKSLKKPLEIYIKNNIKYNIKRNNSNNNSNNNSINNSNNEHNNSINNIPNNNKNIEELDLYNLFMEYRIYKNLQTSDNLYYQCTKGFDDMAVHSYFSHFETPYDAFITYNDVINDLRTYLLLSQVISLYSKRFDKLKNELNNLIEKCPKYVNDNKRLNMEIEKLNKVINELYDELEKINKKHLITINNKKYEIEKLNSKILKLEETVIFLKEKCKELEQIKEEKNNLNKIIRELQKDKAQLIEKLNNEKKEKIKINERLIETKKKLEDIEFKVISKENSCYKEIEKLNNEVNNLKNELNRKIEIIKKLKNEKVILEENIINLKKEIKLNNSKLNETIKNLESNLEFKDKHIKDINSEISKLNTIITNLKKNYNDLQNDVRHKEENIRILNNERIKLLNKLKELDSKNNENNKNKKNKDNNNNNKKNKDNNNPKKKDLLEKAFGDLIIGS